MKSTNALFPLRIILQHNHCLRTLATGEEFSMSHDFFFIDRPLGAKLNQWLWWNIFSHATIT